MSRDEIASIVDRLVRRRSPSLRNADPADKAEIYTPARPAADLPAQRPAIVRAEVARQPCSVLVIRECPRGDLNPHALLGH